MMIRRLAVLVTFLWYIGLASVRCQNTNEEPPAYADVQINGSAIGGAIREVAHTFRRVIGLEDTVPWARPDAGRSVTVHLTHTSVTDALDAITKSAPEFLWFVDERGDFRVRARDSLGLAAVRLKTFETRNSTADEALKSLDKTPEVTHWLNQAGCRRSEIETVVRPMSPDQPDTSPDRKAFSVIAHDESLGAILDRIAEKNGTYFWAVVRWGPDTCRVSIRVPTD